MIIQTIGDRVIVMDAGTEWIQNGMPLSATLQLAEEHGVEVSLLHFADQLSKNGAKNTTIINLVREATVDVLGSPKTPQIAQFLSSSYEDQREQIFNYLYGDVETAKSWANGLIKELRA